MSKKNRSLTELQENIDNDFITRRNELQVLKDIVKKNSKNESGKIFAKNLIVFLYAHWEGFIKYSSECLLQFISHKNLKNRELGYGLLAISNLVVINDFLISNVALKIRSLEYLFGNLDNKAEIPYNYSIATYSKLNTETLEEICLIVGIDESTYSLKKGIIDEKLVQNRNNIAHGTLIKILPEESIEIFELIFPILESYKTDILNKAVSINS
jgi:hypothetical protein